MNEVTHTVTYDEILTATKTIGRRIDIVNKRLRVVHVDLSKASILYTGDADSVALHWLVTRVYPTLPVIHHCTEQRGSSRISAKTLNFIYARPFPIQLYPHGSDSKFPVQFIGERDPKPAPRSLSEYVASRVVTEEAGLTQVRPFFDWTEADVWALLFVKGLEFSQAYEDQTRWADLYRTYASTVKDSK